MIRTPPALLVLPALAATLCGQSFDVVSIKHVGDNHVVLTSGSTGTSPLRPFNYTPNSFSCRQTLSSLVREAYQVLDFQVKGPEWVATEVYEVKATMPEGTSKETTRLMLQAALVDRFGLQLHREPKEFQVFRLVVLPDASKLEEITPAPETYGYRIGMDYLDATSGMPMLGLASVLSHAAGRPVFDETGLKGAYKVNLHWNADPPSSDARVVVMGRDSGLISALSQLGLKLEPAKRTMDLLTVEKATKEPSAN